MKNQDPIKRISVEVKESFLIELKKRALNRKMTLKRYVTAVLAEQIIKEARYD